MNYDEIVEALKCCAKGDCLDSCPYGKYDTWRKNGKTCSSKLMVDALNLIREQNDSLGRLAKSRVEAIEIGKELGRKENK